MPEHFPSNHHEVSRPPLPSVERRGTDSEDAYMRFVELELQPGSERILSPVYKTSDEQRIAAYIRTSATDRGDVDALQLEDIRGYSADKSGIKWAYGQALPENTKYLLVNSTQVEQSKSYPEGEAPRGFTPIIGGQTYNYGRDTESVEDFAMGTGTSRNHFQISLSDGGGEVIIRDLGSTHGLALMERMMVTSDGTPVRQLSGYTFDPSDITDIDARLQRINTTYASDESKAVARELITSGTFDGKSIDHQPTMRKASAGLGAREYVANVAMKDYEIAKVLVEEEIVGFHGTRSIALPGIMQQGLRSAANLRENGHAVLSGEHIFQYDDGQKNTSFGALSAMNTVTSEYAGTNSVIERSPNQVIQDLSARASAIQLLINRSEGKKKKLFETLNREYEEAIVKVRDEPDSIEVQMMQHDFPVLVGVSRATVDSRALSQRGNLLEGNKSQGEFRLDTSEPILPEGVPVIAVPKRYVGWVSGLMRYYGNDSVRVIPIEPLTP